MRETNTLPIEYLRERLRYEPDTGRLFWLDYEDMSKSWRTRWAGKDAFTTVNSEGYHIGTIDRVPLRAHRVIWALANSEWPTNQIDHINNIKTDNRITNLRVVTNQENNRNMPMRCNNTSGVTGVNWHKPLHKWRAQIKIDGRTKHLGYFETLEEAAEARKEASKKYGFSERHGTPTNVGEACD